MSDQREFAATEVGSQRRGKSPAQKEHERVRAERLKSTDPAAYRRWQLEQAEREGGPSGKELR